MLNTLKTILGFITSVLEKHTPLKLSGNSLEDTYNHLKINEQLADLRPADRGTVSFNPDSWL